MPWFDFDGIINRGIESCNEGFALVFFVVLGSILSLYDPSDADCVEISYEVLGFSIFFSDVWLTN